jgi:hypothetical protein
MITLLRYTRRWAKGLGDQPEGNIVLILLQWDRSGEEADIPSLKTKRMKAFLL